MGILPVEIKSPANLVVALAISVAGAGWLFFGWPMPPCPFHEYLGVSCPMCGSTRACYALLAGRVADAFRLNPIFWYWVFWCVVAYVDVWTRAFSVARPSCGTRLLLYSLHHRVWLTLHVLMLLGTLLYLNFRAN